MAATPEVSTGELSQATDFKPSVYGPSPDDVLRAREELERIKQEYGWLEPDRGNLNSPGIDWREGQPDYTVANLSYFRGKTKNHGAASLELVVENLVKTWEMEASHKPFSQWTTVNHEQYSIQANGGRTFLGEEAATRGNYNTLMDGIAPELYDAKAETFDSSHQRFRGAFPGGFPWEVLEVYAGPPRVAFSWRHWAPFEGEYEGHKGTGETVNLTGFAVVTLGDNMKVNSIEVYYDPTKFLEVLQGKATVDALPVHGQAVGAPLLGTCPFAAAAKTA